MSKKAPDAPDYKGAAEASAESNREAINMQTYANRINQYNPWGSLTYEAERVIDPATGQQVTQWTQNQDLTPQAQEALDKQLAITNQKSGYASQLMDRAGQSLLAPTDWEAFTGFGDVPQAFGVDGSRRSNPRPMYQTQNREYTPIEAEATGTPDTGMPAEAPIVIPPPPSSPNSQVVIPDNSVPPAPEYLEPIDANMPTPFVGDPRRNRPNISREGLPIITNSEQSGVMFTPNASRNRGDTGMAFPDTSTDQYGRPNEQQYSIEMLRHGRGSY